MNDMTRPTSATRLSEDIGDVLSAIRRLIAEDDALTVARSQRENYRSEAARPDLAIASGETLARRYHGNAALARRLVQTVAQRPTLATVPAAAPQAPDRSLKDRNAGTSSPDLLRLGASDRVIPATPDGENDTDRTIPWRPWAATETAQVISFALPAAPQKGDVDFTSVLDDMTAADTDEGCHAIEAAVAPNDVTDPDARPAIAETVNSLDPQPYPQNPLPASFVRPRANRWSRAEPPLSKATGFTRSARAEDGRPVSLAARLARSLRGDRSDTTSIEAEPSFAANAAATMNVADAVGGMIPEQAKPALSSAAAPSAAVTEAVLRPAAQNMIAQMPQSASGAMASAAPVAGQPLADPAMPETAAPMMPDADNEKMIRDVIRDMIQEELHGELGQRFARNLRAIIRREISAAIDEQMDRL